MGHYLVTGCAGFIGARVVEGLLASGHRVLGVDNLNAAYDLKLKDWRLAQLQGKQGFEFVKADICDRHALGAALGDRAVDGIINLAARAGVPASVSDPWAYADTNVIGVINLLELARERELQKFVQASTSSLYGEGTPRPFVETADVRRPISPYSATKGGSELLCYTYHYLYGIDTTVLRYFTVYGPAGRPDMSIFRFVQWIAEDRPVIVFGDGEQERDFTFVDDVASGTEAAIRPLGFEIINLGSDRPVALRDVISQIEGLLGKQAHIEHRQSPATDIRATWANIDKANELLGWQPETELAAGLQACVRWYLEQRQWAKSIDTSVS
jgi:nucleoside-diphosphate-sugar epimerase